MKTALIIALGFALAGCATHQASNSGARKNPAAADVSTQPPFVGMTKAQIGRLLWRVE